MHRDVAFADLAVGDIFYTIQPFRQYFVKLLPHWSGNGDLCNAEELESGQSHWWDIARSPIYRDDGGQSWNG